MKRFIRIIIEKEFKTPTGRSNVLFGVLLIAGFFFIETVYSLKELLWKFIFHTEPTDNSFKFLVIIVSYLIFCVLILFWGDSYRERKLLTKNK